MRVSNPRFEDPEFIAVLKKAAPDLRYLLGRGYPMEPSLRFIGNRYQIPKTGRDALLRSHSLYPGSRKRAEKHVSREEIANTETVLDGYNVIMTVETALLGKPLFLCSDGTIRDIRNVGGKYKFTRISKRAVEMIFETLFRLGPKSVDWIFDEPVPGSGDMSLRIREWKHGGDLLINGRTARSADKEMKIVSAKHPGKITFSSDAAVIDRVNVWFDLAAETLKSFFGCTEKFDMSPCNIIDLVSGS